MIPLSRTSVAKMDIAELGNDMPVSLKSAGDSINKNGNPTPPRPARQAVVVHEHPFAEVYSPEAAIDTPLSHGVTGLRQSCAAFAQSL